MKIVFVLCVGLLNISAMASDETATLESWRIDNDYVMFVNIKNKGMRISKGCEDQEFKCDVWKVIKSVSLKSLQAADLIGGKNLGAVLCHRTPKAQIIFARNVNGQQATFCSFSDGSMVDSGGLLIAAKINDSASASKPEGQP